VDNELLLSGIASLATSTPSIKGNLQKKQSTVVRGIISRIHKVKQNNSSISPSMCFSYSTVIDGLTVNGLLLIVDAFAVFFITSSLYFSCKEKQNVNVRTPVIVKYNKKYVDNSPIELLPPECTTCQGLKGHFSCDPSSTLSYQAVVDYLHAPMGMS
jgi:hypothetical protein